MQKCCGGWVKGGGGCVSCWEKERRRHAPTWTAYPPSRRQRRAPPPPQPPRPPPPPRPWVSRDRRGRSPQRCCAARRRRRRRPPRPPPLWHCRGSLPCGCGCQELRCVLRRLPVGRACGGAACGACLGPKVTRFVSWPMRATHTLTLCGACKPHSLCPGERGEGGEEAMPIPSQRRGGGGEGRTVDQLRACLQVDG